MKEHIFIGITNDNELVSLELDYNDLNKGTEWYNPHYSLCPHIYRGILDEVKGEELAHERLADEEYWKDLGYLSDNIPNVLTSNINWEEVATDVINSDGWEMTNGEWQELGEYDGKNYFIDLGGIGHDYARKDFKQLFITETEYKFLMGRGKEWKEKDVAGIKKLKALVSKKQNITKIIKAFIEVALVEE